ncbi:lipopolysaccharide heptosyltransferase II [Aeromonas sp. 602293]|uniref:lipopolysaccharide heptosyltransferase II n=1 Tax=Aeromonas sp. 602293 TaxID=2712041 RepID=UPI003BA25625
MKILVIGPSWVGDMVMSQSLYKAIKANHPECELHVMAPAWCCALLERMLEVDKAITMPLGHGDFKLVARRRLGKQLAAEKYDQAIVQPNSMKSALIPWFARIPVRTGWKGESRYGLLNDLRSNKSAFPLMVEGYLALAYPKEQMKSRVDIPTIPHPALHVDLINQSKALERLGLDRARPVLVLCPGAEFGPAKRWPEGHYAVVAQQHLDEGWQVWIFGSNKDVPVANTIRDRVNLLTRPNCHVLAGKTSLHEAIDLMALASRVISNDSGLMHIAAALNRPLVGVYGSTSPLYTPPLADRVEIVHTDIECRPCFKRTCKFGHLKCLIDLAPEQVVDACKKLEQSQ